MIFCKLGFCIRSQLANCYQVLQITRRMKRYKASSVTASLFYNISWLRMQNIKVSSHFQQQKFGQNPTIHTTDTVETTPHGWHTDNTFKHNASGTAYWQRYNKVKNKLLTSTDILSTCCPVYSEQSAWQAPYGPSEPATIGFTRSAANPAKVKVIRRYHCRFDCTFSINSAGRVPSSNN